MNDIHFVHLHVHTEYSLLDGAIRIDSLIQRVKEFGMDSIAITDHGVMFGVVEFYEKVKKAGLKPIIGCECYVAPRTIADKTPIDNKELTHLLLLAENMEGYRNLCKMASIAQLDGFYYKPRIDKTILAHHCQGLIALSACLHGEIPSMILKGAVKQADEAARFYQNLFGEGRFFLEVQNNGMPAQDKVNAALRDMSQRLSIPLVASNDCHYLNKEDVRAHDVLLCIQTGKTIKDSDRFRFGTDQLYFKSKEEMHASFADYPGALENTVEIANRCCIEFDFKTYHFPKFVSDSNQSADELFESRTREGFRKIIERIRAAEPDIDESVYQQRLDYEISVIKSMGFSGYFLIVADFIHYAKTHQIPVGPGRGSAAGSLVAYSLGITDLDPLKHGLIFERFLNPARISMPDIDVDFCINGRDEVFRYVAEKYGGSGKADAMVAQIITFGSLKSRAVIRDVGRALDIPLRDVDMIAKLVPEVLNISLDEALKQQPKLTELAKENPQIDELINISRVLEGLPRHASTHAAGVVIGDKPLVEYLPLYKGKKDEIVTQYDMKCVEKIGLVKFDFLGLRNLTVIQNTLSLIAAQNRPVPDLSHLDFNDPDTYRLLSKGDTTGVFQLESSGMKDLLVRLKPACFDDITALVALYRPGPLDSGMVDDFVERKHGRKKVEYLVPQSEPILKETYGVIVYQEQVMKIAGELAKYSMAEADGLRKAMGKKIPEIMAQHRERFVKGAVANGVPEEKAVQLFDLMEKFGGYGFNKSHSAAYALITFQTAYLKAHYPVEFMASLLTSEMNSIDGVVKFIAECRSHGIPILPPDINESHKAFSVVENKIRFGLLAVKNVGENAIDAIIEARTQGGRFTSLFDFCTRVDLKKVNKRVIESLIKCGAFDSTHAHRSQMLAALEDALDYGQRTMKEQNDSQISLFGGDQPEVLNPPSLPKIAEMPENQRLTLEKESLGFYITGHPLSIHADTLTKFTNANSLTLMEKTDGSAVRVGGIIRHVKPIRTKKGDMMAFVTIEDLHGSVELTVFSSLYTAVTDVLSDDRPVMIEGKIEKDENSAKIVAETIIPMEKAEETWTAEVCVRIDITKSDRELLKGLHDIFKKHPGNCQTILCLRNPDVSEIVIHVSDAIRLKAGEALSREINGYLGYPAVETVCRPAAVAAKPNGYRRGNG